MPYGPPAVVPPPVAPVVPPPMPYGPPIVPPPVGPLPCPPPIGGAYGPDGTAQVDAMNEDALPPAAPEGQLKCTQRKRRFWAHFAQAGDSAASCLQKGGACCSDYEDGSFGISVDFLMAHGGKCSNCFLSIETN